MKKYLFLLFPFFALPARSQDVLTVAAGTDLYIAPDNIFHAGGLTLSPSTAFTLNGTTLTKATSLSNPGLTAGIPRVYRFSNTTAPFSGTIRLRYEDSELGGANELALLLRIHNGSSWLVAGTVARDGANNYVEGSASGYSLGELTLSSTSILPLTWKSVSAYRQGPSILVEWRTVYEAGVKHFSVERSTTGERWQTISENIAARNTASLQTYHFTDTTTLSERLFYRIRQTDNDGRQTYSSLVAVATGTLSRLALYPNPVAQGFSLQTGSSTTTVKAVQLYNASGMLVKTWPGSQPHYLLPALPSGTYYLSVLMRGGETQQLSFIKN